MLGFLLFYGVWSNLGEACRNKVLGNIFGINDVSTSSISIMYKTVIFRLYGNKVFHQFVFIFDDGENIFRNDGMVIEEIVFIDNCKSVDRESGVIYRLMQCREEKEVYLMLKEFL